MPQEGPALVACNHISYFDQFADGYFLTKAGRRSRFLAKAELFENSLLRRVLAGSGQIPVERGTGSPAPLEEAAKVLADGGTIVIYPEGTVTRNPDFTPMKAKTGVARLSLMAAVPVTPLASWGSQHIWQKSGPGSFSFGRPIWLKAGAPMDFSQYEGAVHDPAVLRKITDDVMEGIGRLVDDLHARYPRRWS